MMSNLNFSVYDLTPTQDDQEYGASDPTNDTADAVPLVYVPTTYNIQYTGVTSFEFNGTTFYNYHLYEAPVLSYPVYDYIPEVYPDDYQYGNNTAFSDVSDDILSHPEYYYQYSSSNYDSISSDVPSNTPISIISYSEFLYTSVSYHNSFNSSSTVSNNSYTLENNVSFPEISNSSHNSIPSLNENDLTNSPNISCPTTQVENRTHIKYEESVVVTESDINTSACNTQDDVNNYDECSALDLAVEASEADSDEECEKQSLIEENRVLDWSVEVDDDNLRESDNDLDEEYGNHSFFVEETKVPDWSVEVADDDENLDYHDDAFKGNLSKTNDMDPYKSTEVVKYLKDNLYLYALSGYMSLKESVPVVDILPIITEETESVEVDDRLEGGVDDLEHKEEKLLNDVAKNEIADVCFERAHPFKECRALECTVEDTEQVTKNVSGLTEKNLSSVPTACTSEQSKSEYNATQSDEIVMNDDKLKDTKLISFNEDCSLLPSGDELKIPEKNVLVPIETDNVFNANLKLPEMHNNENEKMSKRQNDCIIILEESGATQINSVCPLNDTQLKPSKEVEIRNELILNQVDSNSTTRTECHVPQETGCNGECYSERNVEKRIRGEENVHRKTKKKKFHTLRKWFGNLCCCAKRKT